MILIDFFFFYDNHKRKFTFIALYFPSYLSIVANEMEVLHWLKLLPFALQKQLDTHGLYLLCFLSFSLIRYSMYWLSGRHLSIFMGSQTCRSSAMAWKEAAQMTLCCKKTTTKQITWILASACSLHNEPGSHTMQIKRFLLSIEGF